MATGAGAGGSVIFRSFNRSSGRVEPCAEASQVIIADIKSVPSITTRCLIVAPQKINFSPNCIWRMFGYVVLVALMRPNVAEPNMALGWP